MGVASDDVAVSIGRLWVRYALHFVVVAVIALVACFMAVRQPGVHWGLLLVASVLGGWGSSSLVSNTLLGEALTRRQSRMSALMQVLWTVCWSVANLVLMAGLVVVIGFATGMLGGGAGRGV